MLYRKAYDELLRWKNKNKKKALCITGARQIGKTTLITAFGKENYDSFVSINFITEPRAKEIFQGALSANRIIEGITSFTRKPMKEGNTLILLDEIQECPEARSAIKFLVEDGRFDYMESGSLLGVKSNKVPSIPVGFEEHLQMYPMDIEEFLIANGVQKETIKLIESHFEKEEPINEVVNSQLLQLFYTYIVVGGMPSVVDTYVRTHDIGLVIEEQKNILSLYRSDIIKYAEQREVNKIKDIFDSIPSQLYGGSHRFILSDVDKKARMLRYENSFLWLSDAGVALPCYNIKAPELPLALHETRNLFKLFLSDTGLLSSASDENIQFDLLQGNVSINSGALLENVIAEQLVTNGFALRYFNSKQYGEVDFVIQQDKDVVPIEVKSGNDYRKHKALDNVLAVEEWNIPKAYVLCNGNIEKQGKITYLPWYMVMFLKKKVIPEGSIFKPDISALLEFGK